jgi:hypothetical protein
MRWSQVGLGLLLLRCCAAREAVQQAALVAQSQDEVADEQQGEQQGVPLNPRIRLHRRRRRAGGDGSGHAAANISAVQMLIQGTPEPMLDKRIAIPERSSDVAINDRHGDSFVVHFANGFVDAEGVVRSSSGAKPGPYHGCWLDSDNIEQQMSLKYAKSYAAGEVDMKGEAAVVVLSRWSSDFFHWMAEVVPRVVLGMPHLRSNPRTKLLIDCGAWSSKDQVAGVKEPPLRGFINETLKILEVPRSQVLCYAEGRVYRNMREAVWPSPSPCGSTQVTPMRKMLTMLPRDLAPTHHDNTVLLYKRPDTRRLLNHNEVHAALKKETSRWPAVGKRRASLRIVDGSGTLDQQIKVFRSSRCLVGPHGAGMVMMLFAPQSFGTAEVSPGEYGLWSGAEYGEWDGRLGPNHCFRFLSAKLGLRHAWVVLPWLEGNDAMEPEVDDVLLIARDACGVMPDAADAPPSRVENAIEERFAKAKAASDVADVADAAAKEAAVAAARADAVADAAARDAAAGLADGDDGVGKRATRRNTTRRDAAIAATSRARLAHRRKVPRDSAASRSRTQLLQTDADAPAASEDSAMARESERLLQQKARRDRALVMSTLFAGVQ